MSRATGAGGELRLGSEMGGGADRGGREFGGSANGIRTRVPALRGQCPRPLDDSAVSRRCGG